jgi:uncharacterized protein YkwD
MCGRKRLHLLFAVAALLVAIPAATTGAPVATAAIVGNCTPGNWGTSRPDLASQVVDLVNQQRAANGLGALVVTTPLTNAAVWKARHMAYYSYMAHDDPAPPVARTTWDRLDTCGVPVSYEGENIAYGYQSPAAVMNGWMNSSGHRANILSGNYKAIGVGAASNSSGILYWAQDFSSSTSGATGGGGSGGSGTSSPTVSLTSKPASSTTSTSASFAWTTTGSPTSTTCALDGGFPSSCTSPKSYSGLGVGGHTFQVTVSNSAGSASATYTWQVTSSSSGTVAPTVSLTGAPASSTTSTSATFAWTTTGSPTSTTCTLDGGSAASCSSPKSYSALAVGTHTFKVTVANSAGSASATFTWQVTSSSSGGTTAAPTLQFTSVPPSVTTSRTATFAWATTGSPTSTTCVLDGWSLSACSSPKTLSALSAGLRHTFRVAVSNSAGSVTSSYSWYVY